MPPMPYCFRYTARCGVTARKPVPGELSGPPGTGFLAVAPQRAVYLKQYGIGGIERWHA